VAIEAEGDVAGPEYVIQESAVQHAGSTANQQREHQPSDAALGRTVLGHSGGRPGGDQPGEQVGTQVYHKMRNPILREYRLPGHPDGSYLALHKVSHLLRGVNAVGFLGAAQCGPEVGRRNQRPRQHGQDLAMPRAAAQRDAGRPPRHERRCDVFNRLYSVRRVAGRLGSLKHLAPRAGYSTAAHCIAPRNVPPSRFMVTSASRGRAKQIAGCRGSIQAVARTGEHGPAIHRAPWACGPIVDKLYCRS
jgi:hypothetical protein